MRTASKKRASPLELPQPPPLFSSNPTLPSPSLSPFGRLLCRFSIPFLQTSQRAQREMLCRGSSRRSPSSCSSSAHLTMARSLGMQNGPTTCRLQLLTSLAAVLVLQASVFVAVDAQVLTPPYFNLAQGRNISATATCGIGGVPKELFCRLTGATGGEDESTREVIRGQLCDHCNPEVSRQDHRPEYATDGTERWWQSPPLSRGVQYNQVNLTVHLGQEFHVAYVFIRMANSPRPGVWVLERSTDFGKTWQPWQFFADTPSDCLKFFETTAEEDLYYDDQVLCTSQFSKVVPLEGGEIVVSLVNGRPSAENFSNADVLQEWTKATDVQLRMLRTKTLLGHLMAVARQDPTVTRRYYYSIKDISIGGRCVCNGHAETCDRPPEVHGYKLICSCVHNTCGDQCDMCCPGFVQKRWRRARVNDPFVCEPCQCYGHSNECIFDEEVEKNGQSIDIHGHYDGGGVCQSCRDNTMGINCEQCVPTFYRPNRVDRSDPDACRPCECDLRVSTGECEEGSGRCLCRPEYAGLNCDRCNSGYYGYPDCIPCDCHVNGTEDGICTVAVGVCPCKVNYDGRKCDMCTLGYYNFPECRPCECNPIGSQGTKCDLENGQCQCRSSYAGRDCNTCADGYFGYPNCDFCTCDPAGTEDEICDKERGNCLCRQNYTGDRCDRCVPGHFGFPNCRECQCKQPGSRSDVCDDRGQCSCNSNFAGLDCGRCAAGYYRYPDCVPCQCDLYGSLSVSCDQVNGQCRCRDNFEGQMCQKCKENFYNYPMCEVCNCNPAGSKQIPGYPLGGCGIITVGLLCECKDKVQGRICDQCQPGYWNLDRNDPQGCRECSCHLPGTLTGSNVCNTEIGQCMCKPDVGGRDCDTCRDGYFDLRENNPFGCTNCMCNHGGSQSLVCNKNTGQCQCRPRVAGQKCNQPIKSHFYPNLHQLKLEIEDGVTPEGYRVRYGYDNFIFPSYSWRGYAILTDVQPEVLMEVNIRTPSLYRIIYRYVNRNAKLLRGDITLTPDSPTDNIQSGEIVFLQTLDPKFATVTSGAVSAFVLNPGRWTISTKVPDIAFLDYFVLIPQDFYEATVLQQQVTIPCAVPGDQGPCLHYQYPDLIGYPFVPGIDGYMVKNGERVSVELFPNVSVSSELGTRGLAHLNPNQTSFKMELVVPESGLYALIVSYHNPGNRAQKLDVDVASLAGRDQAKVNLHSCNFSTLCRQVFTTLDGMVGVYNISTGYVSLTFTGPPDVDIGIDSVTAIPIKDWTTEFIRPRIICIRINGICIASSYSVPVGTVRVDFELPPNEGRLSIDLPTTILDTTTGLVQLNDTEREMEIFGTVSKPGQYIILFHYYMPTEIGLTIPVTVFVGGQAMQGMFKPTYCPSVTGCRGAIIFGEGNTVRLMDNDIRILVNNTRGGKIWLDYALLIPAETFTPFDLELQPIDTSGKFLTECVNEGFKLNSDSEYCRESVFTLTTEFNKGAVQCDCNVDGSLNFNCQAFGGQCQCRDNVIGRTCSACRPNYYGFPNCRPCSCPYGVCHPLTGDCICPPRVEGDVCDRCEPEAYGYDNLIGCQECKCNQRGVERGLNCDQTTGQCNCLANVGGRKCDTCLPGHHSFPHCQACDCDPAGTQEEICDQYTSQCLCKSQVQGGRCDQCPEGSYHLSADNPLGCTRCFCFGTTTRCASSSLAWDLVNTMDGWGITNTIEGFVIEAGNTIAVKARDDIDDTNEALYWVAPPEYLGNKMYSYGGQLIFTVLFTLPREQDSEGLIRPDVILEGNNMTVVHYHPEQPQNSVTMDMDVALFEYNFRHARSGAEVSHEQFMMILHNLQALHIRASYFHLVDEVRLSDVSMGYATQSGPGERALTVEQCQCPPSYQGTSCQECAQGHYRSHSASYLGSCVRCNCHRHSNDCNVVTGECHNCQGNTTGPNCEQCLPGYFGDATRGDCQICSCPLPLTSNNFATECRLAEDGLRTYCTCFPGYYGPTCESCAPGFYGNPREVGSYCQACRCNDNIDVTDPYACDRFSGQCMKCLNHTAGVECSYCQDWYWGDAMVKKDCQACTCDQCGSQHCDKDNGYCECKPNVVGNNCDQCALNMWGFEYCDGCRECECGVGAVSAQCDLRTGRCECQPGVQGEKCDRCLPGHWNMAPNGCLKCNCLSDGAVGCDENTGNCICLPGVTGPLCDRCFDRWVLVPGQGCQECDYCIHLLLDDLYILDRNVSTVRRQLADVSVGVGAFNRLAQYNSTLTQLRPQVGDLYQLDQAELQATLDPLKQQLATVESDAREIMDEANQDKVQTDQLQEAVDTLATDAADADSLAREQVVSAENAVQYVKQILAQILASIKVTNIQRYIGDAERILDDVRSHNFTKEDNNTAQDLAVARDLILKINTLIERAESQLNRSLDMERSLNDILERLLDLGDNTETSTALKALDDLRRLKAQNLEEIAGLTEIIEDLDDNTRVLLNNGTELLLDAEDAVDAATNAFEDLGRDSSRMDQALNELISKVNRLNSGLQDVEPLVNQSSSHAQGLHQQAIELDNLYNNTRDLSANAVTAGQAYKNIVQYIDAALNNSMEAVMDADGALNETNGNREKAAESLVKSRDLSKEADTVHNLTSLTLSNDLKNAKDLTDHIVHQKAQTVEGVNDVRFQLRELDGKSTFARAQNVYNRARGTRAKANATYERIERITALLPEDQKKLENIGPDRTSANLDIKNIDSNLETVRSSQEDIKDLLEPVKVNATRLVAVGERLDLDVQALKEKIELAREQANRIRVGLRFLGNSTVTARKPPKLEQMGSYSQMSMFFKSTQSDALLAYVGGPQRAESNQNDFLSLELIDGRVVFKYNLGSGPAVLASSRLVNDGKWHQAVAERIGKSGTLTVRTEKEDDDLTEGNSPSTYTVLELNQATTKFYLGGVPDEATMASAVTRRPFIGSMEDVKFDNNHVGLWNFEDAQNNLVGEFARDVMKEIVTSGMRFNGMGYVVLNRNKLGMRPNKTDISLFFQTFFESGLLVYMSDEKRDFLSIELRDGRVVFQYDLGGGPVTIEGQDRLNDGEWHSVSISRSRQRGQLRVDDKIVGESSSPGSLSELSTTASIFIGGNDQVLVPVGNVGNYGFDGCIRNMQFGTIAWDLNDNQKAKGVMRGCPAKVARIATYRKGRSDSFIGVDLPQGIGTTFDLTFKMRTKQSKAIVVYIADDAQESTFSVSIMDGKIVMKSTQDGGSLELISRINTYNDSKWHFVSIMKDGLVFEMNIDDYEMLQTMAETGTAFLDTTTPLYLGGVPPEYSIADGATTSKNHFVGCIGDITVRQKFVNLVTIPESRRMGVQLVECPLHTEDGEIAVPVETTTVIDSEEEVEEQTTMSPDQCFLPLQPAVPSTEADVEAGIRFGSGLHSRVEFNRLPSGMRLRSQFSLSFKTTGKNGLLFYVTDKRHIDFLGLYMVDGELHFGFNCGSGAAKIMSGSKYNDGNWHKVEFGRVQRSGQLMVDGVLKGRAKSRGGTRSINVSPPYFFGGMSESAMKLAFGNVGEGWVSFPGCMRDLSLRMVELKQPIQRVGIQTCTSAFELGTFFPAAGGVLQLVDQFKVGQDLEVSVDIRPRTQSGVILAVHGKMDYVVLQIVEGQVNFVVDNGAGAISTTFSLPTKNTLCDGKWHTIKANKNKNVVTLVVDGVQSPDEGVGSAKVSSADTNHPLYVGGVPDVNAKGILTQEKYVGCVRNLRLNEQPQSLSSGQATGDIELDSCPVN